MPTEGRNCVLECCWDLFFLKGTGFTVRRAKWQERIKGVIEKRRRKIGSCRVEDKVLFKCSIVIRMNALLTGECYQKFK